MGRRVDRLDRYIKFRGLNDNKVTLESGISVGTLGKSRKEGKDITSKTAEMIFGRYPKIYHFVIDFFYHIAIVLR